MSTSSAASASAPMDHGPPPVHHHHHHHHHHTHASPLRRMRPPTHAPTTPATAAIQQLREERALHQPSPNRTEAAAAMMHLFSSSVGSGKSDASGSHLLHMRLPVHPPVPGVKVKRKYVRKAPRKPSSAAKKLAKIAEDAREDGDVDMNDENRRDNSAGRQMSAVGDDAMGEPGSPKDNEGDANFAPFREYNRKEKSLGLLCENFLRLYRSDDVTEICLDRAATQLGVERRRIYDIVNILESIHLVSRKSKNLYNWHGLGALPVSTTAMKKKYVEMQMQDGDANSYDYNFKDRRRGKSLSKLSQMFVQLFLKKDHCIIPLDQAAKQLIQMEDSENEEDRQLKTKIRRLYDVANVLVSVGLIEKMQLTNSRKPVFRWKYRGESNDQGSSMSTFRDSGSSLMMKNQLRDKPIKTESSYLNRNSSIDESDPVKTSQSCDSDNGSESSDSQSETGAKRKPSTRTHHPVTGSGPSKRTKIISESPLRTPTSEARATASESVLRFNQSNVPIHPQIIFQEQQLQVRQYMERYIQEYIDHMIMQQVRRDPLSLGGSTSSPNNASGRTHSTLSTKEAAAALAKEINRTPLSIPSLVSRVTGELTGNIHELLFPNNSTSPQSVADLLPTADTRSVTQSLQKVGLTTPPSNTMPGAEKPRIVETSSFPTMDSPDSASPSPSSSDSSSGEDDDAPTQARRLFKSFQPPASASDVSASETTRA